MELTSEEKQFIVDILTQVSLNYQSSQIRDKVIQKLVSPTQSIQTEVINPS